MYTDGHGSGKEASEMSVHTSQRVRGDNSAPEFDEDQDPIMADDQAEAKREVPETRPIPAPLSATRSRRRTITATR